MCSLEPLLLRSYSILPGVKPALADEALATESRRYNYFFCSALLWRKCLNITSLSGSGKVETLPPYLPVVRLAFSDGEILNTCKCQMKQPEPLKRLLIVPEQVTVPKTLQVIWWLFIYTFIYFFVYLYNDIVSCCERWERLWVLNCKTRRRKWCCSTLR